MNTLLNGRKLPEDASVPFQILYLAFTPLRLLRQRTAVNLIVSYVAMAVVTVLLLLGVVISVLLWPSVGRLLDLQALTLDPYLGEQARSYGQWLDPQFVADLQTDGVNPDESAQLQAMLELIASNELPGFDQGSSASSVGRVAHAAVLSADGVVLASHDPGWVAFGDPITAFPDQATRVVAARSLMLDGATDPVFRNQYSLEATNERTSASYPLITDQGVLVGILVLEGNPIREVLGLDSRSDLVRYLLDQVRLLIWIVTIPAIIVAIPFGWWRSRSISKRLNTLTSAADSMAEGNLATRVSVSKPDEIGRLGERFNEMAATIESNERQRRAFIANVSHELRTPISIIQGTVERQLDSNPGITHEQKEALQLVQREAVMLELMISDLFTVTKGQENELRLVRRVFNVADLATEVVGGVKDLAWSQSRVSMESLIAPDLPLVYADPIRVRQVLNNLMYNALRHTPEGGLVVIQGRILSGFLEVSVSDTGRGIPSDEIDRVFERYYQAERDSRHDDGSGLGLNVVQQLVRAHGGEVAVESIANEGTTFRFTLPLAP